MANALENYRSLIEQTFGQGTATFSTTEGSTTPVISALNGARSVAFTEAFRRRLERLAKRYDAATPSRAHLLEMVNEVASVKNWNGAYAELVAADFLNSDKDWLPEPISLSRVVPAAETMAEPGKVSVEFDGYYDEFDVLFDVKVFSGTVDEILNGIAARVIKQSGTKNVQVLSEFPPDLDVELLGSRVSALTAELTAAIDAKPRLMHVKSQAIPELSFRFVWGSGMAFAERETDPYRVATVRHTLLFQHCKNFSRTTPSLIVFVASPWFGEEHDVFDAARPTYRSICRRIFCQYAKNTTTASAMFKKVADNESIASVTAALSGIVFIEDESITSSTPDSQNIRGYVYLNPNAVRKVSGRFQDHLKRLEMPVDGFEDDNY